ncbi:MAG: Rpn family recombination-promoting nuclease/putative transposase [Desulfovibrio sp.]|jgi:hypothetical protein|nr:Rpn family recombination-promoting nuclease/putative transposase [Desulfovibrio sp.]
MPRKKITKTQKSTIRETAWHDKNFKACMSKGNRIYCLPLLALPQKLSSQLNPSTMNHTFLSGQYKSLFNKRIESDLMVEFRKKEPFVKSDKEDEEPVFILHVEHVTESDKSMVVQAGRYHFEVLWYYVHDKDQHFAPKVITIIVGCGPKKWDVRTFKDLENPQSFIVDGVSIVIDCYYIHLRDIDDERLLEVAHICTLPYLWKGLALENSLDEVVHRLECIIKRFSGDIEKEEEIREFLQYLLGGPYDFNYQIMEMTLERRRSVLMDYQRILTNRLEEKARQIVHEEGRREGRQEGRQEGRLEGRLEGRQEGRQEGELEGRRSSLVTVVQNRFKDASQAIIAQIQQIWDIDILQRLLGEATSARNWKSFEKKFSLAMANS